MVVISRNTAFTYRKTVDTKQIGRELGIRYLLEGSVRRSGNQIRVNAQLIDGQTDTHLWAEHLTPPLKIYLCCRSGHQPDRKRLNVELAVAEAARPVEHLDASIACCAVAPTEVTVARRSERSDRVV